MNSFISWLTNLFQSWKFWIVIPPWDNGVRVRLGKRASLMKPGLHFRLPSIDDITLVNTRLRICGTPTQTLPGSTANKTKSIGACIGYRITDPLKAMMAYTAPEPALSAFVQARVAADEGAFVPGHCLEALRAEFDDKGIAVDFVYATENVEVRTYRIISNGGGMLWSGGSPVCAPAIGGQPPAYY